MKGQKKKSKSEIVEEYIKRVNIYEKPHPIAFDLRAYAAYITEHGLKGSDITPEIMNRFIKEKA